ncbi:hypothetical protein [Kistimonas asteriae]|uniref:hypothetical protein n=1 Tax=Kistimonas asteriae TaxID=517724 RepID=UPI001BAA6A5A|nr:hypothetical protein [Kistimonas asteriae]
MLTLCSLVDSTTLAMDSAAQETADGVGGVPDDCQEPGGLLSAETLLEFSSFLQTAIDSDSSDSPATVSSVVLIDDVLTSESDDALSEIGLTSDANKTATDSGLWHQTHEHEPVAIANPAFYQTDPDTAVPIQPVSKEDLLGVQNRFMPDAPGSRLPLSSLHQGASAFSADPVNEQPSCQQETVTHQGPREVERFLSESVNAIVSAIESDAPSSAALLTPFPARGAVQPPGAAVSAEPAASSLSPVSSAPADSAVTLLKADNNNLQLGVEPPGMGYLTIAVKKQDQQLSVQLMTETATDHHLLSAHGDSVRLMLENPGWGEGRFPPGSVAVSVEKTAWSGTGLTGNEESPAHDPQGSSQPSKHGNEREGPLSSVQVMQASSQLVDLFA